MAIERLTESLTLQEMRCDIGPTSFGYVHPHGSIFNIDKTEVLLNLCICV